MSFYDETQLGELAEEIAECNFYRNSLIIKMLICYSRNKSHMFMCVAFQNFYILYFTHRILQYIVIIL